MKITKKNVCRVMCELVRDEMSEANTAYGCYAPDLCGAARARNKAVARFVGALIRNTPHDQLLAIAERCGVEKHRNVEIAVATNFIERAYGHD